MNDLRITLRKGKYVIQDYANGRKQVRDRDNKKLSFKYKKEAQAYAKELSGAIERKEIKLSGRHNFKQKFKEYGLFRLEMAHSATSRDTIHGVSGLQVGNTFSIPDLPGKSYSKKIFQITSIEHIISQDLWTTSVEGSMRNLDAGSGTIKKFNDR